MFIVLRKVTQWWMDYLYVAKWQFRAVFFSNRLPTSDFHKDDSPIVLIPGVYESWHFMWPVAARLAREGHAVHIIQKLGYNTDDIPYAAEQVREYIVEHNLDKVIIVAHSKGGLVAKYAMMSQDIDTRIRHMVAINTPFSGSIYAHLFLLPSVRVFLPGSPIIKTLKENLSANARITSIYGTFDPHIPGGSHLEGARNIQLPLMGHFKVVGDPMLLNELSRIIKDV